MNMINRLLSMLPEGNKKQELVQKYQQLQIKSQKRGGEGLNDVYEFQPKGHIKIESIDESGNVVGLLADQPNLVVNGAEEILLRAFSGDPNRILYKNRHIKDVTGVTGKIYISESKLQGLDLFNGSQLLHAPNILWEQVDDKLFDISYGYYPTTLYVKEELSTEVGKKAFSLSNTSGAGLVPITSEIYSTYTNLFIGIGEGKNVAIPLTDARLTYTDAVAGAGAFTTTAARTETSTVGDEITFTQKISNFALEIEASNTGAQIDVFINGVLRETIESYDSLLGVPVKRVFEYTGLDYSVETTVRLVHSGGDVAVITPVMAITGISFDALTTDMNGLMKEFKNFETDFLTPTVFNTTPMAPFTIQLPHFPVVDGSVHITYEGIPFTEVETVNDLTATSFVVDPVHGVLTFNRALTGVLATFSITGEIYDTEKVTTMTAGTVPVSTTSILSVTGEVLVGVTDGVNKNFTIGHTNADPATLIIKVNGSDVTVSSFDPVTKVATLAAAPSVGNAVTANYSYSSTTTTNKVSNVYLTSFAIMPETIKIYGDDGVAFTLAATSNDFGNGKYLLDATNPKKVILSTNQASGQPLTRIEILYKSTEQPGVSTGYTRAVIEKPKTINEYPWFELDKGAVKFIAEFPELKPGYNVTIREMGLFDGPRADDQIAGFKNYPVKVFSLVRVGETRKEMNTGIRITWTITLLNANNQPYKGGLN